MYGKQLGPVGPLPVGLITGLVVLKSEGSLPQPHPQPAATGPLALPAPTGDLRPLVPASQTGVLQGQLQPCPLATSRGPREGSRGPGRAGPALRHGRGSGLASAPCQCEAAGPRAGGLSGAAHVQQGARGARNPTPPAAGPGACPPACAPQRPPRQLPAWFLFGLDGPGGRGRNVCGGPPPAPLPRHVTGSLWPMGARGTHLSAARSGDWSAGSRHLRGAG